MILTQTNWSFLLKQKLQSAPMDNVHDDYEEYFVREMNTVEESKARVSRLLQEFELSIGAETNHVGYFAIISCSFLFGCREDWGKKKKLVVSCVGYLVLITEFQLRNKRE